MLSRPELMSSSSSARLIGKSKPTAKHKGMHALDEGEDDATVRAMQNHRAFLFDADTDGDGPTRRARAPPSLLITWPRAR